MQARFSGKVTEADLKDVRRILRSKMYWPKLLAANWYGVLLLCVATWGTIAGVLGRTHPKWNAIGCIWLVIAAMVTWSIYRTKRVMAKQFLQLNTTLPDWVSLETGGVKLDGPNGATAFKPWSNFKGWREGQRVFLLDVQAGGFVIIPVPELSEIERESIRQFIQSHVAPANAVAATAF